MTNNKNGLFKAAPDGVDPALIPYKVLADGTKVPAIGLGTFGSDNVSHLQVAGAVREAILAGYRHIDCASVYGNEQEIGFVIKDLLNRGLKRSELWITSKVWNDMHGEGKVIESCKKTLKDLQLDYLDLYLIHWPFPNYHAPGVSVESRDHNAKPYKHENYMVAWRQMEKLVTTGMVKHIGTSNMTIPKLKLLLNDAGIKPAFNELEMHPHFQQPELFNFIVEHGIQPIGYCPIGSPGRPARDRTPDDTIDIEDPLIIKIANRLKIHPVSVCIKWAIQHGQIPIPFSSTRKNILSNLYAAVSEPLTDNDMQEIKGIDKNCRLIKGQVFLWDTAAGWEDLWDINGNITIK